MRLRNIVRRAVCGLAIAGLTMSAAPSFAQLSPAQLKAQKDRAAREAAARNQAERQRVAASARAQAAGEIEKARKRRESAELARLEDMNFYAKSEENSCAIYSDYPKDAMLRIAYKGSTQQVFFQYFSEIFSDYDLEKTETFAISTENNSDELTAFLGVFYKYNDRTAFATDGGIEILDRIRGSKRLFIHGKKFQVIADLNIEGVDAALKWLEICGANK